MSRPPVDVVVPFAGSTSDLRDLLVRVTGPELRPGDSLVVVDNGSAEPRATPPPGVRLVQAVEWRSAAHARNYGARIGAAPWIVFLDADVDPSPDLLDRYFDRPPEERTGVLAGLVVDGAAPGARDTPALRYARLTRAMSQENTLGLGRWAFAQTANCAMRRLAFEQVGGFRDALKNGEDVDLGIRLTLAGWQIERRYEATVVHRNRPTLRAFLAQRAGHGRGIAWVNRAFPGSFPRRRWAGLALWTLRRSGAGLRAYAAGRRDAGLVAVLDPPAVWAYELGRLMPNRAPRTTPPRSGLAAEPRPGGAPRLGPATEVRIASSEEGAEAGNREDG